MGRKITVIIGHPDPAPDRFCRALAQRYAEGARAAGHEVRVIDLAALEVPFLRSAQAFKQDGPPASLAGPARAVVEAEHLVLVFPLWLGGPPAMLKAFLEQVLRPGTAFRYGADGKTTSLLRGHSARLIVTMGMPAVIFRLWFGQHGVAALRRSILNFVGIRPVRQTLIGMVENASDARRQAWLSRAEALGKRGV